MANDDIDTGGTRAQAQAMRATPRRGAAKSGAKTTKTPRAKAAASKGKPFPASFV